MAGGPSMRVYRAAWSTNCERVAIALAHKGLEVSSVIIDYADRGPVESVSGQPLVPVLEDGRQVIADSVAILRYLERRNPEPPLFYAEPSRGAELDLLTEWFERAYKPAPNAIDAELAGERPDAEAIAAHTARMRADLDLVERLLDGREYLLGEFSAADCVAYPFLKYALGRDPTDDEPYHVMLAELQAIGTEHPRLRAWIERVGARPRAF